MGASGCGRRLALAGAAGIAAHLAYPRPGWDVLAFVSLAPVVWLSATAASPRQAALEGWVAGWTFFVLLLRWITHTMTTYSSLPRPVAILVLLVLAGYLAIYWGAVGGAVAWLVEASGRRAVWLTPVLWVAAELVRAHALSGFPWGLVGYAPYRRLALIQVAAWTGVYGISFLLVLVNTALAWVALERTRRAAVAAGTVVVLALGGALLVGRAALAVDPTSAVPVALVQGNIDQAIKWDHAFRDETLGIHEELTRDVPPGQELIVWPEAAVPVYLAEEPAVLDRLRRLAGEVYTPLLVGAPDVVPGRDGPRYLNSAFLVRAQGVSERYDKMHLVPFGEYVPLKGLLFFVQAIAAEIGDFTPGRQVVVFPLGAAPFGTVICYEVIFPNLFRQFVAGGARFMVNITNDAWFGDSGGPLQHLAMVPFRAVENGVAIVRAANTGVSALVATSGAIGPSLGIGQRGTLRLDVPIGTAPTFYTRFGDLFAYTCGALAAAALTLGRVARRRS
jgi:apolipoprotein N-acyltransferase